MFRKAQTLGGTLILAAAMLLVTPSLGRAQRYVRSYRSGNYNYGGFRTANARGYYGGYYPYLGGYAGYPSYRDSGATYDAPYTVPEGTTENPGYAAVTRYYLGGPNLPAPPDYSYPAYYPQSSDVRAQITVKVPADALVWFDDEQMTSTGPIRTYDTPSLPPGQYSYDITASWNDNGRAVTQTKRVVVSAGALVEVDFPARAN